MIKISIRRSWDFSGIEIVFWEERNGKIYAVKPMELIFEEYPEGTVEKPSLRIPHFIADEFLKSLAEVLDGEGIKTDKDAKIQGTLEATRYHLEDLRKMLKIK